jgi:DNA-binding NarL/FixJ family response regulator
MKIIRILVVEDNRILRDRLAATINGEADMKVVAAFREDDDLVARARNLRIQVVLLGLHVRRTDGTSLVAALAREIPGIRVIGTGLLPSDPDFLEAVEMGASGFILKDATMGDVLTAIRLVAAGTKVLPPPLAGSLFSHVIDHARRRGKKKLVKVAWMTRREQEIIALIAEGLSNREIANRLSVATHTVKSHVHNILDKLALHSRLQIAAYARNDEPSGSRPPPATRK